MPAASSRAAQASCRIPSWNQTQAGRQEQREDLVDVDGQVRGRAEHVDQIDAFGQRGEVGHAGASPHCASSGSPRNGVARALEVARPVPGFVAPLVLRAEHGDRRVRE